MTNFRNYYNHWWWGMVIANAIHQSVAETILSKARTILSSQSQVDLLFPLPNGAFGGRCSEGGLGSRMM